VTDEVPQQSRPTAAQLWDVSGLVSVGKVSLRCSDVLVPRGTNNKGCLWRVFFNAVHRLIHLRMQHKE